MFLGKLVDRDRDSVPQAHPKDFAARQLPHVVFANIPCAFGLGETPQVGFFGFDLERDDGVVPFLNQHAIDHQFHRGQALCPIRAFPVTHTEQFSSIGSGDFDRAALTGFYFFRDMPVIEPFSFEF